MSVMQQTNVRTVGTQASPGIPGAALRWAIVRTDVKPPKRASLEVLGHAGAGSCWLSVVSAEKAGVAGEVVLTRVEGYKHAWSIMELVAALGGRRLVALGDKTAGAQRLWARVIADERVVILAIAPGGSNGVRAVSTRLYQKYKSKVGTFKATVAVGPVEVPVAFARSIIAWARGDA